MVESFYLKVHLFWVRLNLFEGSKWVDSHSLSSHEFLCHFVSPGLSSIGPEVCVVQILHLNNLLWNFMPWQCAFGIWALFVKKKKSFWFSSLWRWTSCLKQEALNQCAALPKFSHSLEQEASNLNCSVPVIMGALHCYFTWYCCSFPMFRSNSISIKGFSSSWSEEWNCLTEGCCLNSVGIYWVVLVPSV